jgi:hypothetical protein
MYFTSAEVPVRQRCGTVSPNLRHNMFVSPLNVKISEGEIIVLDISSPEDDTTTLSRNVEHMFTDAAPNSKELRLYPVKT